MVKRHNNAIAHVISYQRYQWLLAAFVIITINTGFMDE